MPAWAWVWVCCVWGCPLASRWWWWRWFTLSVRPSACPPNVRECVVLCCVRDAFMSLTWMLQCIFGHPRLQHTQAHTQMRGHMTNRTPPTAGPGCKDMDTKKEMAASWPETETCCVVASKTKKCPWHLIHAALMWTENKWSCSSFVASTRYSGIKRKYILTLFVQGL